MTDSPWVPDPLTLEHMPTDPLVLLETWVEEATEHAGLDNPNAMCLSSVGEDGVPEGRIVLLKAVIDAGLVFFTNRDSRKGRELDARPRASLNFFWDVLGRQIRVVGEVERVSDAISDGYFASRPRGSQIGAWASSQSRPISDRASLEQQVREYEAEFEGKDVPRPEHWGGYRVTPIRIEFWQSGEYRLHDRFEYRRGADGTWTIVRLSP